MVANEEKRIEGRMERRKEGKKPRHLDAEVPAELGRRIISSGDSGGSTCVPLLLPQSRPWKSYAADHRGPERRS